MINSIPLSALKLRIDFQGYRKLSENIHRMSLISKNERQKILEIADKELSSKVQSCAFDLQYDMADDREVYKIAGLSYANGPPEREKLFITAIADYLLKHKIKNFINQFRSEEHTSELQSHSFISYAVFCLKKKKNRKI